MRILRTYIEFINENREWSKESMKRALGEPTDHSFAKDIQRIRAIFWLLYFTVPRNHVDKLGFNLYDQKGKLMEYARRLMDNHYLSSSEMQYLRLKLPMYANQLAIIASNVSVIPELMTFSKRWEDRNRSLYPENKPKDPPPSSSIQGTLF